MTTTSPSPDDLPLHFSAGDWDKIIAALRKNPKFLLLHSRIRELAALRRMEQLNQPVRAVRQPDHAVSYTIEWNAKSSQRFGSVHSERLIRAALTIDPVYGHEETARVLAIGPRNEEELLLLFGLGFQLDNVKAIDLISSSPLIQLGDMHSLPFPDSRFELVLCGWTLPYSRDHQRVVHELVRVCVPGGLVAIGLTRVPPAHSDYADLVRERSVPYQTADQIIALFGAHAADVPFRHEPPDKDKKGDLMVIVRVGKS